MLLSWRLAMGFVDLEVFQVLVSQLLVVFEDDEVLGVFVLGLVREIKAARQNDAAVDHHHLVVGDGMLGVDKKGHLVLCQDVQIGMRFFLVAPVEQDLDVNASFLGFDQGVGNGVGRKGIGLHENLFAGPIQLADDSVLAAPFG